MTTIINGSSPSITFSDGSAQTSATRPFLNRLINGGMTIDQRNAGASVTVASSRNYYLDRFTVFAQTGSKLTIQQNAGSVTPPAGFTNYAGITVSTAVSPLGAADQYMFEQQIEGYNVADLNFGSANAKTITLSFWVRSSLTGTFAGSISNGAEDRTFPFTYTISTANTWEYETITIAGDLSGTWLTTNGSGLRLKLNLGTGATYSGTANAWTSSPYITSVTGTVNLINTVNATWYITGVQLEVGSTATSFDYRPIGTELALCQRYYQQITGTSGSGYYGIGTGTNTNTTIADILAPLPVTMRVIPTTSFSGTIYLFDASGNPAITSISNTYGGQSNIYMGITATGGGLTVGRGVYLYTNNSTSSIFRFSAEL